MIVEHGEARPLRYGRLGLRTVLADWIDYYQRKGWVQEQTEPYGLVPFQSAVVIREQWRGGRSALNGSPWLALRATVEFR